MALYRYDIGIIGGGAAGFTVAAPAAQVDTKIILVEKEEYPDGDCPHHTCVPSKALIESDHLYYLMKSDLGFGLPGVDA